MPWGERSRPGQSEEGVLLCATASAQRKTSLNTITRVEVKGTDIEIVGSKKPSFTPFSMQDPSRLVIDLSEAVFSGVPEQKDVGCKRQLGSGEI